MSIPVVSLIESQVKTIRESPELDDPTRQQIARAIETLAINVDQLRTTVTLIDARIDRDEVPEPEYADVDDDDLAGYDNLFSSVPRDQYAPPDRIVRWVFDSLSMPYLQIDPVTVPNRSALQMLRWARENQTNFNKFMSEVWSKSPTP